MEAVFNIILEEIIKRKRTTIPMVILTGTRFSEYSSKYSIYNIDKTILEKDKFKFKNNISGKIIFDDYKNNDYYKQEKFIFKNNTSGTINFEDYKKELLYLKLFTKTISTEYKHLIKSTAIIKINDTTDKVFYMYIKLCIKGYCKCCGVNNDTKYRIVYSSSFDDLVNFIYKQKQIPDFLNSEAFISKEDKTIEQYTIIKNYNETFIKKINYDIIDIVDDYLCKEIINYNSIIVVNLKNHTLTTTINDIIYSTKYKVKKDEWFVNEIITKGSNTISVKVYQEAYGVDICISNDIEILKKFFLSEK
jgi:hypothetical protein